MDLLLILIALTLVLMNAFFVAAEFAMVKLRQTRVAVIKRTYGVRGKILSGIHKQMDAYLSACQLGITLASLGLGWVGEPAFAHLFEPIFHFMNMTNPELVNIVAFFIAFSLISFLHIVIGELMPKSLAIRQSEKISLWTAMPLYGFYWLMYPAIWVLNSCSNLLLKLTHLDKTHKGEYFHSTDEIKFILSASHLHGELTKDETEIIEHTLDFADLKVTDAMRPQENMIMLRADGPIDEALKIVAEYRYSRYPVYQQTARNIIGIIHVKDLFAALYQQHKVTDLRLLMRPILKVSYRLSALHLLRKFRKGMPHFALVYKGPDTLLGFVTLDNLLHILIGRIKDEFHRTQNDWTVNDDNSLIVKGSCPLSSLERALDQSIDIGDQEPEPETIAGLILNHLGRLPTKGEHVEFKEFQAIIIKLRGTRMTKIQIVPKQQGQ
ncbi:MAG: hypothetical protein A3E84_02285 [Gammaproteobacteria bacterium RIFCSPHIGHO2_12_FULL_42_13]|nr:MAG: hypothetical protein A3E84_02285 [Gammaproteobacteria bacterium RIFCSPHIGHO2_12_FULL_42_13]